MPQAEAAVVEDGRFTFVGAEKAALAYLGGRKHDAVDAEGTTALPGLNDAHLHYAHTCLLDRDIALGGARSRAEVVARLRKAPGASAGGFLVGRGWNQDLFDDKALLTREDLDQVSTEAPVFAVRVCGHIGTVNTRCMALCGISAPDGILREDELGMVYEKMPAPGMEAVLEAMLRGQHSLFARGITSIQSDDLETIPEGREADYLLALKARAESGAFRARYALQANLGNLARLGAFLAAGSHRISGPGVKVSCAKLYVDGSLGARTAHLSRPYADAPETSGVVLHDDETLQALVGEATRHGLPVAIHAIGDAAMERALNAFEKEGRGLRNAVVHAQLTTRAQVIRCGQMGLTILAQPIFLDADAPIVQSRAGGALAETSYRWRSMLAAGAHVAFSTDAPVEPFDPMPNLYCAMTRRTLGGVAPYLPEEAFTLSEALYAYTAAGAYASGEEREKGRIAPGMLADFVLLDTKLSEKEPASIREAGVKATFVGGKCVYEAGFKGFREKSPPLPRSSW